MICLLYQQCIGFKNNGEWMIYKLFALILLLSTAISINAMETPIHFSKQEEAYLKQKKEITMCVDPDWVPFEVINAEGKHEGISADLISLVANRTGLNIKLIKTSTWDETVQNSKSSKCDILSFVNQTPKREEWLIFTQPLLLDPNVIITREEHPFVANLSGLDQESVALPKGTAMLERMSKDFPNLKFISVVSEANAMKMVSEKEANMTMRSLIVAAYVIKKEGWFNLKISGQPHGYENNLRIGVLKDQPILRNILDKGIETITQIEREAIINKHTGLVVKEGINLKYLTILFLIIIIILWRYYDLKRYNKKLIELSITDKLTGLFNRLKIDEKLYDEQKMVSRYVEYHCSIIMIDIDFFKSINDTYGHQQGDETLKALANLMKENFRNTDLIGRWGGEEFIIILPNTPVEEAYKKAEKIRIKTEEKLDIKSHTVTISAGVGSLLKNESVDEMLKRVDTALYRSKENGRNITSLA